MNRITNVELEDRVKQLNIQTGNNTESWNSDTRLFNLGTYYIEGAYGGVKLVQVATDGGGVLDVSKHGFGTKKELYIFLSGMLAGVKL